MITRLRRQLRVLIMTIIVIQSFLVPIGYVYAEIIDPTNSTDELQHDDLSKVKLPDDSSTTFSTCEGQEKLIENSQPDPIEDITGVEKGSLSDQDTNNMVESNVHEEDITETQEELRFSIDVGEYISVNKSETFSVKVEVNQLINSLRLIVPKGTEFSFSDESSREVVKKFDDESTLWLIKFDKKLKLFPVEFSLTESGQISVEDYEGEIHAAFLYVNTSVSGRSSEVLSEANARSTVYVSTWANFRTAWNNNNRTVIILAQTIPTGTTQLNHRTSSVTMQSQSGSGIWLTAGNGQSLSWSQSLVLSYGVNIRDFVLSGDELDMTRSSNTIIINNSSSISTLNMVNASLIETSAGLSIGTLNISGIIRNSHSQPIKATTVNTTKYFSIRDLSGSRVLDANTLNINDSLMSWDIGNTTTVADRGWQDLQGMIINNSIVSSSDPLFNDQSFQLPNSSWLRGWGSSEGGDITPPVTKFTLDFEGTPVEGGLPASEEALLAQGDSTTITANPANGYRFDRWEIVSGTGASIANTKSETTTFTMGGENALVRAIYEETDHSIEPVNPTDPLDPEVEVNPENTPELPEDQGQLSIDFISSFDFGSQVISVHDQIYYAQPQRLLNEDGIVNESEERPNYVQISDRRPENERNGWELAVTQKEQFKSQDNQVLNGASLSLSNQKVISAQSGTAPGLQSVPCTLVPGNRRTLLKAQYSEGTGTWIYRFGDRDTAGESVSLNVPKGTNPEATTYSTTLVWELSSVPVN